MGEELEQGGRGVRVRFERISFVKEEGIVGLSWEDRIHTEENGSTQTCQYYENIEPLNPRANVYLERNSSYALPNRYVVMRRTTLKTHINILPLGRMYFCV